LKKKKNFSDENSVPKSNQNTVSNKELKGENTKIVSSEKVEVKKGGESQPSIKQSLQGLVQVKPKNTEQLKSRGAQLEDNHSKQKKTSTMEENASKTASVRKAAEKYENKNVNSDTSHNSINILRLRSKSIGNARKDQFEEGSTLTPKAKANLPWATKSPPTVNRKDNLRSKGYALQMSKSSDSITAAKLLAKARAQQTNNSGLRINQNFSKSIEKQLDVFSKTKEEIRLILSLAKSGSVNDRIALFSNNMTKETTTVDPDAKAESIRREIQEARAKAQETVSDTEIEFQEPVESKVKPLKIPMKPKLIDKSDTNKENIISTIRDDSKLAQKERRLSVEELPCVQKKISTYLSAADEGNSSNQQQPETPKLKPILKTNTESSDKERSRSPRKKTPKLVSDHYLDPNQSFQIYTQSATDMSATEDELELSRGDGTATKKRSASRQLCSDDPGPDFLKVPPKESLDRRPGVVKSKSFASTGQFEGLIDNELVTSKKQTMMAFFNTAEAKPKSIMKQTAISQPVRGQQRRSSLSFITDDVLAEDDFVDIDAEFENLLTKTFEQETKSAVPIHPNAGRVMETSEKGRGATQGGGRGQTAASVGQSTTRQANKRHPVGKGFDTCAEASPVHRQAKVQKSKSFSAANLSEDQLASLGHTSDMQQINQQMKQGFDPVAALPSSQTARTQQLHAKKGPVGGGGVVVVGTPQQSPSPTQSEYDTADPWDDY